MILRSKKSLVLLSIVLLVGTIFGTSAMNAFADNTFKNIADDPFKNIAGIHDDIFPVGFSDKIRIYPH